MSDPKMDQRAYKEQMIPRFPTPKERAIRRAVLIIAAVIAAALFWWLIF